MSDRDELAPSATEPVAAEVGERVTAVLTAAETAANAIRHEAEQQAQMKRRAAEAEVLRYTEEKKREADELLASRLKRISEVSDGLVERAETIVAQLDEAEELKRKMQTLVGALGDAAEELAKEMAQGERPALSVVRGSDAPAKPAKKSSKPRTNSEEVPEVAPEPERQDAGEPMSALDRLKAAAGPRREAGPERRGRFSRDEDEGEPAIDPSNDELLGARLVALQMAVAGSQRDEVERHLRNAFQVENPSDILDEVFGKADIRT